MSDTADDSTAMDARPGDLVKTDAVPNLRDVGGYETSEGRRVRYGLLYRSTALAHASDSDLELLRQRAIRTVYDLRTPEERATSPDRLPAGVSEVALDVMADARAAAAARIPELADEPKKASKMLEGTDIDANFERTYRDFITMPSATRAYHDLFLSLADEEAAPALYHCATGKDRTGWATAAFLLVLGVPERDVMTDYLLSNDYLFAEVDKVLAGFAAHGADPEQIRRVLGVKTEYLDAALSELHASFGSIDAYFSDGLGLDAAVQEELRRLYLQ